MGKTSYDLEERSFQLAKNIRLYLKKIPKTISLIEDSKQLIRASGSVGANYIEVNEALGKKDFLMRIKICRKEAKECAYFFRLIIETHNYNNIMEKEALGLINKSIELKKIFSSILAKSK